MKRFKGLAQMVAVAAATLLLASCGNTVTSPLVTGNLSGRVILTDEVGANLTDFSGATVSFKGTSYSATTAADGTWKITGLPQGTYAITVSKAGYFTYTDPAFRFVGRGDDYYPDYNNYVYLTQAPVFSVTGLAAVVTDSAKLRDTSSLDSNTVYFEHIAITGNVSTPATADDRTQVTLTFSTRPAGSADSTVEAYISQVVEKSKSSFAFNIPLEMLRQSGFSSGARVYIIAYPGGYRNTIGAEPLTNRPYPLHRNLASNEVSVVMP